MSENAIAYTEEANKIRQRFHSVLMKAIRNVPVILTLRRFVISWRPRLKSMRADLGYADSSALERLLIQQLTLCSLVLFDVQ